MNDSTTNNVSAQLIDTLQNPAAWPETVSVESGIKLIETHISWVLLTDDFAWKIKKPVQFDFLDFSTLERREHFCRQELRLNRRFAPGLYLGVVPIAGTLEQPQFLLNPESDNGQPATPFEYAVCMRKFDQSNLLSHLVETGQLDAPIIDELADRVAAFHESAERLTESTGRYQEGVTPDVERLAEAAHDNFEALQQRLARPAQQELIEHLESWTAYELDSLKDVLAIRRANGMVRHCHGDLHLGNIAIIDDNVSLFDCIEFNEEFRWIDVMSEVAFVVMDLEERGQSRFAWRFLNRYLERCGDYEGVHVLPFFLVYRALVRAKIDAIRLEDATLADNEQQELRQELTNCLDVADDDHDFVPPTMILMHGVSGSGKSYMSQQLMAELPAIRVRSDVERKRLFGLAPEEHPTAEQESDMYSSEASHRTYERLLYLADTLLLTGHPVIVDATFLSAASRLPFLQMASQHNCRTIIIGCTAPHNTLLKRVSDRVSDGSDASDADLEVLSSQSALVEPPGTAEADCVVSIDTSLSSSISTAVAAVRAAMTTDTVTG